MENFWKGKKVFLTGGSGFIGSHLLSKLYKHGALVTATQHINPVSEKARVLFGADISDNMWMMDIEEVFKPDVVIHLAAYPIVTHAEHNPSTAFSTNVVGTYNILSNFPNTPIIVASTDKVYGRQPTPYTEDCPLLGTHQIYEATKVAADVMAQSFYHSRKQSIAITRACNIFGYDKAITRIIPYLIHCARTGQVAEIRSGLGFLRDYLYVDDIVDGYMRLAQWRMENPYMEWMPFEFNFGGHPATVSDLVVIISDIMQTKIEVKVVGNSLDEIPRQTLDYTRAYKYLGWKPNYSLISGLKKTVNEYLSREMDYYDE